VTRRLEGRVVIVTGGGGGIGLAYCRRFLDEGAKVVIAEIGREQGEAAEAELATEDAVFVLRKKGTRSA
jgi:NAD(P)-dependent dehydrogenase (short-subunit alcohol dehydrogenase family)